MTASEIAREPAPLVIVLSGPSGVGKDMLLSLMKTRFPHFHFAVTATTRPRRENETDGINYFFVSPEKFREMVRKDELLEWSQVYGNYYGVPLSQVVEAKQRGQDIVLKVDVQGAEKIKTKIPGALLIFVAPPSEKTLAARLRGRKTEKAEDLNLRLDTSRREMEARSIFDYVVVNDEGKIEETLREIESIIERAKRSRP